MAPVERNDCPNPACAVDATGWTAGSGSVGARESSLSDMDRPTGFRVTRNVTGSGFLFANGPNVPAAPGEVWTFTVQGRNNSTASRTMVIQGYARDANDAIVGSSATGPDVTVAPNGVFRDTISLTMPTGTVFARATVRTNSAPEGQATTATAFRYVRAGSAVASLTYADGDTRGWHWLGTVGASLSQSIDPDAAEWWAMLAA